MGQTEEAILNLLSFLTLFRRPLGTSFGTWVSKFKVWSLKPASPAGPQPLCGSQGIQKPHLIEGWEFGHCPQKFLCGLEEGAGPWVFCPESPTPFSESS